MSDEKFDESDLATFRLGWREAALTLSGDEGEFDGVTVYEAPSPMCVDDFFRENRKTMLEVKDELERRDGAGEFWRQSGIDLFLTQNGHGAGFWDRGYGERGEVLSEAARKLGAAALYRGDDGKIYCEGRQ